MDSTLGLISQVILDNQICGKYNWAKLLLFSNKLCSEEGEEMITYKEFKKIFEAVPGEPEFEFYFYHNDVTYMIIKYDLEVTFQRCGCTSGSGEIHYTSLDELYRADLIDGLNLERDWDTIELIEMDSSYRIPNDLEDLISDYNIED